MFPCTIWAIKIGKNVPISSQYTKSTLFSANKIVSRSITDELIDG